MINLLVETKNEYTTHLSNILTPLIYQGLLSIYNEAKNIVNNNGETNMILKIFQSCLKSILTWNTITIDKATNAILTSSQSYEWLNDLIKATLKSNLMVLIYNPSCNNQTKIDPSLYQSIKTSEFIHRVYIECARELWNNPYIMYHDYPPIEIKRNQRDCIIIIKESIKESLRKLLPVKHILQVYLGEDINCNKCDDNFDKVISDVEENYLPKLINKDLNNFNKNLNYNIDKNIKKNNNTEKSQGSIILDIINNSTLDNQSIKNNLDSSNLQQINNNKNNLDSSALTENNNKNNNNLYSSTSTQISNNKKNNLDSITENNNKKNNLEKEILNSLIDNNIKSKKKLNNELISNNINPILSIKNNLNFLDNNKKSNSDNNINIDDKIKKILKEDLAIESDNIDTSLTFNNYQEIFSNSYEIK